jgi:CheY-like chemotaxis protein/DNA-binding Xre family transcriptional regulator
MCPSTPESFEGSDEAEDAVVPRPSHGLSVSALRVLIVDDEIDVCTCLREFLELEGCEVTTQNNPARALEQINLAERFHIIILDLSMPSMHGIEFLQRLRKIDRDAAVIILTGYPTLESATDAIDLDVSAYLQKPFTAEVLRENVARVIRKKGIIIRREDAFHIAVGQRIRRMRKERIFTLKQLSRTSGLSVSQLSQIERAESSASISGLFKISTALDIRLVDLLADF